MNPLVRGVAALMALAALALPAGAADRTVLQTQRDRDSYMVGMDVGHSLAQAADDIDLAAFERAVRNGMAGGKPLIGESDAMATAQALTQRAAARGGQAVPGLPPGTSPPSVDRQKAGLFIGADVGRSLTPIKDELDVDVLMQAVRTTLARGKPLLGDAEAADIAKSFGERMRVKFQAQAAAQGRKNAEEGQAFLAKNKAGKGVFTTRSGLQYMVLRQGSGRRPLPSDRVRVNYIGTLLDGTEFDSSARHGGPAEFPLNQVIAGWTEGLSLMPVGAKYRFWIPGDLAYGEKGSQGIGPNATLVFDVELLDVL